MKVCNTCQVQKNLSEFSIHRRNPDGLSYLCKECVKMKYRENRNYFVKYYKQNGDRIRKKSREYVRNNKDSVRAYQVQWEKNNPDKIRLKNNRRRATLLNVEGRFSAEDIDKLKITYTHCFCGAKLEDGYTIEHLTPISRNGTNWPDNISLLCHKCNSQKHNRTPQEYYEYLLKIDDIEKAIRYDMFFYEREQRGY